MLRKGEVVSLGIFLIIGLLVSSAVIAVSGGPVGEDVEKESDFGDGSLQASILWGVYTAEGELVEAESLGGKIVGAETGKAVSYWQALVSDITVTGKNVDPKTVGVGVYWRLDEPTTKVLKDASIANWNFVITGTSEQFTATTDWFDSCKVNLADLGVNYKQRVNWKFHVGLLAWGQSAGQTIDSEPWQHDMTFSTDWDVETGSLVVSGYVSGVVASWGDLDSSGLSVVFVFLVIFVGLWYWKGRNLIQWG